MIESGRNGARAIFRLPTTLIYFTKFFGVGFCYPAIILPFFTYLESSRIKVPEKLRNPHTARLATVLSLFYAVYMNFLMTIPPDSNLLALANVVLWFVPFIFVLLIFIRKAPKSRPTQGFKSSKMGYLMLGGYSVAIYAMAISRILLSYGFFPPITTGFPTQDAWVSSVTTASHLLWADVAKSTLPLAFAIDTLGMLGFLFLFAINQSGFLAAIKYAFLAVLISPGAALALAFVLREKKMEDQTGENYRAQSVKQKSD